MRIGIEVGGTFTDLLRLDDDGAVSFVKVPSVRERPDEGAYAALAATRVALSEIDELVHGSTVATNAVIERKGARVAFVTTKGFRDLLHLQRHDRKRTFDVAYQKAAPIVSRRDCFEVSERILADGSIETPLNEKEIESELIPVLMSGDYGAVAICLLNAYRNPAHEERVAEMVARRLQHLVVTCSSSVVREFREYERASTTVIAAHAQPIISGYLGRFERHLSDGGFSGRFSVMQSNGGRITSQGMRDNPISALFSGPAAGVIGAASQAREAGYSDLISFDMGGTSTDVCLVENGEAALASETEVDGLPVRTPIFDVVSVGAGCGSVVWVDAGGMLRVGPQSAGANPGPACYGRGGVQPTITDAHVVRGTIRPEAFLGGAMTIDSEAARRAFVDLAKSLNLSVQEAATSAIELATANIVRAIQLISTERGRDPRDYVLVGYGGAGPLHACEVAESLGIGRVLVPPFAGVLSAFGLLASDYRQYDTLTRRFQVDETSPEVIDEVYRELRGRAAGRFAALGIDEAAPDYSLTLEMRHVGQAFEVAVELPPEGLSKLTGEELREAFSQAHLRAYSYPATPGKAVEVVSFRLGAVVKTDRLPRIRPQRANGQDPRRSYDLHLRGRTIACVGTTRTGLGADETLAGPAIVDDVSSTIFVPEGWAARLVAGASLEILREDRAK